MKVISRKIKEILRNEDFWNHYLIQISNPHHTRVISFNDIHFLKLYITMINDSQLFLEDETVDLAPCRFLPFHLNFESYCSISYF